MVTAHAPYKWQVTLTLDYSMRWANCKKFYLLNKLKTFYRHSRKNSLGYTTHICDTETGTYKNIYKENGEIYIEIKGS